MKTSRHPAYKRLLENLIAGRRAALCSQADLGKRLGKPQSYVAKVEGGERRLDVLEFAYWAMALQLEPGEVLSEIASALDDFTPGGRRKLR